ncbi:MAG: bifunctional oligoribonuclease/PAP phosphatase NrnA [Candidatus Woesebacteria bacterium]|nr:MAG: bifunctional oligoribonuclease/PAP phosphatase NrnA [Candidatus Woesebacteria bacterium]
MNYKQSLEILEEIKKSKKVLVNCHRSPDPDSVGSATSMFLALKELGKDDVTIISPDEIPDNCKFLPNSKSIKVVNFDDFDFSQYDIFIIVDSGNWNQTTGKDNILSSKIRKVVIDHHYTNTKEGDINLVDEKTGSCCALLFKVFSDWKLELTTDLATSLLTGIIADTMSFQTDIIGDSAFSVADTLVKKGADRRNILHNLYMSRPIDEIHLMGEMLTKVTVEEEANFAWVAVPKDLTKNYPGSRDAKSYVAGSFIQSIENTDFGFVLEQFDNYCSVSFRSRNDFDVSKIAEKLGGGGHKSASAARLYMPFDQAVIKVLETARKYAKKD